MIVMRMRLFALMLELFLPAHRPLKGRPFLFHYASSRATPVVDVCVAPAPAPDETFPRLTGLCREGKFVESLGIFGDVRIEPRRACGV